MKSLIKTLLLHAGIILSGDVIAQITDSSILKELEQVVVTANRSERKLGNIAIPTQLLSAQMMRATGSFRLQDILQEQTGLTLVNSPLGISLAGFPNLFGAGIQMQGLDPAYTLLLMDGEPLVGRNAGILKLGRVAVGNIKQVEIVRGPSSSLYGADAMAGVINIITEKPLKESAALQLQYGSHNAHSISASYSNKIGKTGVQFFVNRFGSSGYDLDKSLYGKTVDAFHNNSGVLKATHYFSSTAQLGITLRYFGEKQRNNYRVTENGLPEIVAGTTAETDASLNLQYVQQLKKSYQFTARVYLNQYRNNSDVFYQKDDSRFDALRFLQGMAKPEIQIEKAARDARYTAGAGMLFEAVDASRYDSRHRFNTFYLYTQEEWKLSSRYNLITGARVDKRNDFPARFSPKVAVSGHFSEKLFVSASMGLGYRTPDTRQSYALFSNSSVGYSLLGANVLNIGLQKLKNEGQIDPSADLTNYLDPARLQPETSSGINLGLRYTPATRLIINANLFRNDLRNLIDRYTLPFAKVNGQSIYTYHNVNKVYTQGVTTDVTWKLNKSFLVSGGYQYLVAKDKDVVKGIKDGKYLKRDPVTFRTDTVRNGDYGGLLNRSKHSGNIKLMYINEALKGNAWIRLLYTGRFGFTETNGSGVLDGNSEYAKGFFMCNLTLSKQVGKKLSVQAGIENLFNYKEPFLLPNLAGRIYFLNLNLGFDKLFNQKKQQI